MPPMPGPPPFDSIARKWHDLAQRRLDYFTELYRSGRWQHYYTEEAMAARMLDVIRAVKLWAALLPAKSDNPDPGHIRPAA
jgi:uncharacterized repeat protein (TIGR03809 family)